MNVHTKMIIRLEHDFWWGFHAIFVLRLHDFGNNLLFYVKS